ncbi:MAG: NADH-quinone oxidoreductase subunit NuoH [Acidimicrobiia bacterium]|nr:NADH-quinone oxidoreductase subunit NuoH [Acidimicrobiia bacterium]
MTDLLLVIARVLLSFTVGLGIVVLLVWGERKVVADMQSRLGPMRTGPYGILQTVADGLKLLFKEQITPSRVERFVFELAPFLSAVPALLLVLVIPFARPLEVTIGGEVQALQFAALDLNIGLLFVLAMSSIAVYAIVLAGWSSGSKYPLIGGVRGSAQAISYEAAMGLAMVAVVMWTTTLPAVTDLGALSLSEIVLRQQTSFFGGALSWIPAWNVVPQFPAFVIFMVAIFAETNRAPFDMVEAEQEIVAGFHTEYSGMRFAMFFLAEYLNMFTMSALAVSLFLGGWGGPFLDQVGGVTATLLSFVYLLIKVGAVLFLFVWVRASFPRFRYDQLMNLGWKRLIPTALIWLILSTIVVSYRQFGAPWS